VAAAAVVEVKVKLADLPAFKELMADLQQVAIDATPSTRAALNKAINRFTEGSADS
jgi:hypothetical protein